ncbi:2,2-dialkylglycine decarboxylase (pyruvate) [Aquimarina sp. EL_43]|uniref:aspartate aminotransferase family protein n=1 Tax=unclassified Aquimarina TaxID=2627091 RepID=UPI0018C98AEA|nr:MULTISPECIES: aspartate aminotransferase family protein [unclassified Aquimarina]MBG6129438.1 2,2-dialkylglycine decarboxylase (pyruvate) [Aquimarina sp. EL_35]MBG6150503.1 2,2-dialkylglycine decarboxylase (pyruvate) [Aquimarina sp. EL_32]MBG6168189.1 2,2-dialkylglycine decarboxylase (pyruvate) [Aquimarina sp. EL_43]
MQDLNPKEVEEAQETLIRYCGEFSPFIAEKAFGSYIYNKKGDAILDFTSGQMCSVFGHNHPKFVEILEKSGDKAIHLLSSILSPPVIDLAKKLTSKLPDSLSKCIFLNTGSESNEVAIRMAKLVTGGFEIIGFSGSWHGMTAGAQSYTYSKTRKGYGPAMSGSLMIPAPYEYRCPIAHCKGSCDHTCLEVGMKMADQQSVGEYAALIAEPLLSAAGMIELKPDYIKRLKELCDERGLLLIFDEAQTALGRLGTTFAFEQYDVVPDFLTLSKTLGGGLPLAAMVTTAEIEEECHKRGFVYVTSHVSDPFCASFGSAAFEILDEQQLAKNALEKGKYLKQQLLQLHEKYECIGDVRGSGLLLGVEIVKDRETKIPDDDLGQKICSRCLELGLNMNIVRMKGYGSVFRIAPPLTISKKEIDLGIAILDEAIQDCTK